MLLVKRQNGDYFMKLLLMIILAAVWMFALTGCGKTADTSAPPPAFPPEVMDAGLIQNALTSPADEIPSE